MKKLIFLLSFPLLILACANDASHKSFGHVDEIPSKPMASEMKDNLFEEAEENSFNQLTQSAKIQAPKVDRKILRIVNTRFQTEDLNATTTYLEELTKEFNGYVIRMNYANLNNRIEVSIPSENLDAFMDGLKTRSINTDYTRINAQDVTEEFHDISTRLKTKKEVQRRYVDILRNRAQTVDEVLNAEEKIRIIQEEIESIQGRLRFISTRAAMSQVHIEVYQEIPLVEKQDHYVHSFFSKIKSSFLNGWEWIQALIIGIVAIWPIWMILGFLIFFKRPIFSIFRRKLEV